MSAALTTPVTRDESKIFDSPLATLHYEGMRNAAFAERARHFLAEHGLDHPTKLDLQGKTPMEAAEAMLNRENRGGRTPVEWVQLARAENLLSLQPGEANPADLATEVARLDALAGAYLTSYQLAQLQASAANVPADVREPFALLVQRVANAYEAQIPIANEIMAQSSAAKKAADLVITDTQREATLTNSLSIMAATNAFREAARDLTFPSASVPIFADPAGLVILGSTGNDVYERTSVLRDPILIVDPSGDDTYHTTAGSACPELLGVIADCNGLVASVLLDLQGKDHYEYNGVTTFVQGSGGVGGIGVLVDGLGDDTYIVNYHRTTDRAIFMYVDGGMQGYGLAGVGILVDAVGADHYEADITSHSADMWGFSQGFGSAGGVGIAADGGGDDKWLSYGFDGSMSTRSFQGLYPGGTGFYGGVGVFAETGLTNDYYAAWDNATNTDFYAYGFGAFGGTGIFYEDGGDDRYQAVEETYASAPIIVPLLNCAFGTASFAGLGIFLEMGGDDYYFGDTRSPRATATMNEGFGGPAEGEGLFLDVSGDDRHFMEGHSGNGQSYTTGRGLALHGGEGLTGNTFGVYVDAGGADKYTGASPSRDNGAWPFGVDFNAGQVPAFFT